MNINSINKDVCKKTDVNTDNDSTTTSSDLSESLETDTEKLEAFDKLGNVVTKDKEGKILEDENDEEIVFDFKTYWRLIEVYGGVSKIIFILCLTVVLAIVNTKLDYLITTWVADEESQSKHFKYFTCKIVFFSLSSSVIGYLKEDIKNTLLRKSEKIMKK